LNRFVIVILAIFLASGYSEAGNKRIFALKSGDVISGTIVGEDDVFYKVQTEFGLIPIKKDDLRPNFAAVKLKSGDKVKGKIINDTPEGLTLSTEIGELFIARDKIDRIDFKDSETLPLAESRDDQERWYYGKERLIDVFMDPTGYVLEKNVLYFSGFSWGYGLTERFQIMSRWVGYTNGELNLCPKYMLYKGGDMNSESALAVGAHFYMRGSPDKWELKPVERWYDPKTGMPIANGEMVDQWVAVGTESDTDWIGSSESNLPWGEAFMAYTLSNLRASEQGRINYTIGGSVTHYPGHEAMPRGYLAIDADARQNLKLMVEIFYDAYWPEIYLMTNNAEMKSPVNFDFGFIYAYKEWLRFGMHYQRPFAAVYMKF